MTSAKHANDSAEKRKYAANLTDQELYDRFWALTEQVVASLLEPDRRNVTPSVERVVLLQMGISSLGTQKIVGGCMGHGLMSHGAGHAAYKLFREKSLSIPEAGHLLAQGKCWDEAAALFKKGK